MIDRGYEGAALISFEAVACGMQVISGQEAKLLNAVQFNYKDAESIARALGNVMLPRPS